MPDDTGRFVGRYLQSLAALVVLGMVVSMFRGSLRIDLAFVTALVPLVPLLNRPARERIWCRVARETA